MSDKLTDQEVTVPSSIHHRAWSPNLDTGNFPPHQEDHVLIVHSVTAQGEEATHCQS